MKYNTIIILVVSLLFLAAIFFVNSFKSDTVIYNFDDLNGNLVDFNSYKGKYSILTFTFTRCPSICPMINYELNKLRFKYQDKINILSINVDPENDTPGSLKRFMESNQFDWDILIGDKKQINNVNETNNSCWWSSSYRGRHDARSWSLRNCC